VISMDWTRVNCGLTVRVRPDAQTSRQGLETVTACRCGYVDITAGVSQIAADPLHDPSRPPSQASVGSAGSMSAEPSIALSMFANHKMLSIQVGMPIVQTENLARPYERPALRNSFAAFPADSKVAVASFAVIATVVSMSDKLPPPAAARIAEAAV